MAVLGVQLVFSMVMASILQKLGRHYSFGQWWLCGQLRRYLHPTDDQLRTAANVPQNPGKGKGRRSDYKNKDQKNEPFTIPRNTDIDLDTAPIQPIDVVTLHYYADYQWLIDFSMSALVVYALTEVYYSLFESNPELNLSVLWCLMVTLFVTRILFSLTAMYFRTEDPGERMLCISFGFFFLVLAMGVLIIDESRLEFGLVPAYSNFSDSARQFLEAQGMDSQGPLSEITFKIILAVIASILGAFMTFPGLRYAKMHSDSLKYGKENPLMQMLLHINFLFPLLIVALWVKPVVRDFLVRKYWIQGHIHFSDDMFETTRIYIIIAFCLLRFAFLTVHLQSHLNLAYEKVNNLKKEAGRISSLELQRMVTRVFYYLCVVALQYIAPVILLLFMTLLLKTLGDLSWNSYKELGITPVFAAKSTTSATSAMDTESITGKAEQFALALNNLKSVFTPVFYKGVFSFLCWWVCGAWFLTSAFGMVYYSYFAMS